MTTATATDGAALLAAIIALPDDDLPRLAYADWLEEQGGAERSELVRLQLRVATLQADLEEMDRADLDSWAKAPLRAELDGLRSRGKALLHAAAVPWVSGWDVCLVAALFGATPHRAVLFRRGFVGVARCTLADWHEHGPALARAHPVTRVEITDCEPTAQYRHRYADGHGWWDAGRSRHAGDSDELPRELWRLLPPPALEDVGWKLYRDPDAAVGALSAACITWARAQP